MDTADYLIIISAGLGIGMLLHWVIDGAYGLVSAFWLLIRSI